ncbi:LADA_0E02454g1_1 [Lachancea dasiensis]|uniref:LADA_0E02454g1_1 n=1 Tax=Lachancea dasiensis TaxID=1072105 RepID=A0A1G4JAR8_9SACH|nr:LADA_0E02454g1_1 [Lachancea dasiensis]
MLLNNTKRMHASGPSPTHELYTTAFHAVLLLHLVVVVLLLYRQLSSRLAMSQVCLLLSVVFVCVRHRFTRLFSVLCSIAGLTSLAEGLLESCAFYSRAIDMGAATTTTGVALLAHCRSRALLQAGLVTCFCVIQIANLVIHIVGVPLPLPLMKPACTEKHSDDDDDDDHNDYNDDYIDEDDDGDYNGDYNGEKATAGPAGTGHANTRQADDYV